MKKNRLLGAMPNTAPLFTTSRISRRLAGSTCMPSCGGMQFSGSARIIAFVTGRPATVLKLHHLPSRSADNPRTSTHVRSAHAADEKAARLEWGGAAGFEPAPSGGMAGLRGPLAFEDASRFHRVLGPG